MKIIACLKFILFVGSVLITAPVAAQQDSLQSEWTAPPPRLKNWTIFAPKPFAGDNIFKGEAEIWLADAILNVEAGVLTPIEDKTIIDYISKIGKNLAKYSVKPAKNYEFI